MALLRKVKAALSREFRPPDKVTLRDEDGIIGVVTSERFRPLDMMDRQDLIGEVLDRHLSPKEQRRILVIVGVTPEEEAAHSGV
jgi:hypothetical protein